MRSQSIINSRNLTRHMLASFTLAMLIGLGAAQAVEAPTYAVQIAGGTFVPEPGDLADGIAYLQDRASAGSGHVLLQLESIPDRSARDQLVAEGIVLLSYLPSHTWMARVNSDVTEADLAARGVRWMAPMSLEHKVSERILDEEYAPWTAYEDGRRIYMVAFHEDVTEATGSSLLDLERAVSGGYIRSINSFIVALDPIEVPALAMADEVRYISQRPPVLTGVNDGIRASIGVNTVHEAPYGLDGGLANVLVYDAGVSHGHPDYNDRLTIGESSSGSNHATHVAGTVGGDGTVGGGTYKGMAPGAKITSYAYESCNPYCLYNSPQDIEENYAEGLWTHHTDFATNSIGSNIAPNGYPCEWEGDYEGTCQLVDAIATGSLGRPFLSVWAAGNERAYGRCGSTYWTTGVPGPAKNSIVVGATNSNDRSMTWFSSWGPVDDGRIRPDVCAPGCQSDGDGGITSTTQGGGYGVMCGTSMATPATSGVIALVLDQMRLQPGSIVWPLPSTIKALMINTAVDLGEIGPDFQFGFGEIHAQAAVDAIRERYTLDEAMLEQGEDASFEFNVTEAMDELKVTVAWSDPPGEQLATVTLVNNLDIYLEAPSGETHLPWVLAPLDPELPATRGVDVLNPVEQVVVDSPELGVWTLHVTGTAIPEGPQAYSVAANLPAYAGFSGIDADPDDPALGQLRVRMDSGFPNPFADQTRIGYRLTGEVDGLTLHIRDVTGRTVKTIQASGHGAGQHELGWDGRDNRGRTVTSGVYFCRFENAAGQSVSGKDQRLVLTR